MAKEEPPTNALLQRFFVMADTGGEHKKENATQLYFTPLVPLGRQMWGGEETGDSTLYAVPGLGRSQQWRRAISEEVLLRAGAVHTPFFCGGAADASMYRLEHVQYRWSL